MPRQSDVFIEGLNPLLRAFSKLGKEASKELKASSRVIADKHMVPAWKKAAHRVGGEWGDLLASDVRSGADRLPKIMIGKKKIVTSGGASTIMLRYPSDSGDGGASFAPFVKTSWLGAARATYIGPALDEWETAINRVVRKWPVM